MRTLDAADECTGDSESGIRQCFFDQKLAQKDPLERRRPQRVPRNRSPGSPIALQSLPIYWVAYVLLDKKRVSLRGYVLHVHQ